MFTVLVVETKHSSDGGVAYLYLFGCLYGIWGHRGLGGGESQRKILPSGKGSVNIGRVTQLWGESLGRGLLPVALVAGVLMHKHKKSSKRLCLLVASIIGGRGRSMKGVLTSW